MPLLKRLHGDRTLMISSSPSCERGNMVFMVLIAIALIGLLSAAIMGSNNSESSNIDEETLALHATAVQRYASELERAVMFVKQNGASESDIRFAHPDNNAEYGDLNADPDPTDQVFHRKGGGASFRTPPEDVNDGTGWEFYGGTAVPGAGSSKADLVAVLPNVTEQFCEKINRMNGQSSIPEDTGAGAPGGLSAGDCIYGGAPARFDNGQQFYATPNTMDETTFEQDTTISAANTALQACVVCDIGPAWHFYHVLLAR
ncbi:MAG: hypothetical protein ACT4OY_07495 [Alphaproteobacteria bacterium]